MNLPRESSVILLKRLKPGANMSSTLRRDFHENGCKKHARRIGSLGDWGTVGGLSSIYISYADLLPQYANIGGHLLLMSFFKLLLPIPTVIKKRTIV